jgi:two-component system cell cycle sensor histidine kinase/response regulator CckA
MDGRFLDVNPALVAMLGYASASELLALGTVTALYGDPAVRARVIEQYRRLGRIDGEEVQWKRKDHTRLTVRLSGRAVLDQRGALDEIEVIAEDVTEQRRLEDELRQAQKMEAVGRLAGGIAHDFNNLLTAIIGYGELLLDRCRDQPDVIADLEEIAKAGQRARRLTQQLLAFGRKQMLSSRVLDLNTALDEIEEVVRRVIGEDIVVRRIAGPSLGRIHADPVQLEQILLNLAINARDAMPRGGTLTIETANAHLDDSFARTHLGAQPGQYVSLVVKDTGSGMTAETLAQAFEPFYTTKPLGKGTGLGLSTVYGIVKQSGGYIMIESAPGVGATVTIYLPRVHDAVESEAGSPPPFQRVAAGTETILLVEDEVSVRHFARKVLEQRGYRVLEARDVMDALTIAERYTESIHLLLSDIVMPGLNGPDLAQRIVRRRPDIRVLYITGFATRLTLGQISQHATVLTKPFAPDDLTRTVRECLDRIEPSA